MMKPSPDAKAGAAGPAPAPVAGARSLSPTAAMLAIAIAVAGIAVCFHKTMLAMAGVWARSETFMHGFLIAPVALWLAWERRDRIAAAVGRPGYAALVPIALAGLAWLLGVLAGVNALAQFAVVTMLVFAVPLVLGWRAARVIAFPLAFLYFMVPFGEFLYPALMEGTATFTVLALKVTGIPVYREGLEFVVPSGRWSVVEACSGVRYLIASVVAGTLFAYVMYRSPVRRVVFVAVSILVPIVANWVRAYLIVMLGHLSNNRLAVGVDHLIYGWVFFGVVMLIMFWVGTRWQEHDARPEPGTIPAPPTRDPAGTGGLRLAYAPLLALLFVIAIWPLGLRAIDGGIANAAAPVLVDVVPPPGWTAREGGLDDWSPRFPGPSAASHRTFASDGAAVGLYVGYYRRQDDEHRQVSSENVIVSSEQSRWSVLAVTDVPPSDMPGMHGVRETVLRDQDGTVTVVWRWYWIDGITEGSDWRAKLAGLRTRLGGRGDDGATLVASAHAESAAAARPLLRRFVREFGPAIDRALAQTRDRR
ncbi:MAG: exosortase A [Burkholderiales bacterium]